MVCLVFKCKTTTGAFTGSELRIAVGPHENPLLSYALSRSKLSADWSAFNISHMLRWILIICSPREFFFTPLFPILKKMLNCLIFKDTLVRRKNGVGWYSNLPWKNSSLRRWKEIFFLLVSENKIVTPKWQHAIPVVAVEMRW